jgi:hypothetical protein
MLFAGKNMISKYDCIGFNLKTDQCNAIAQVIRAPMVARLMGYITFPTNIGLSGACYTPEPRTPNSSKPRHKVKADVTE